jgi:hypothetical protein
MNEERWEEMVKKELWERRKKRNGNQQAKMEAFVNHEEKCISARRSKKNNV